MVPATGWMVAGCPGSREARPRAPRRPGRRRSRVHGQEFVAAEDAVTVDVETVEEGLAVAEFLAGEDAVTVGVPAVEHAGQQGAVAVLRVADVPVAVGIQDVEGSALPWPFRAREAAVAVAVLEVEALVPGIVGHPPVGVVNGVAGGGSQVLVARHHAVAVAVGGVEVDALVPPLVAGEEAVVVAVELTEALLARPRVPAGV